MQNPMTRRGLVAGALAGTAATALPAAAATPDAANMPFTAAAVEGPFYFDPGLVRADIAEGRAGIPLEIVFLVHDETGAVFPGARVDVWHCNAQGFYSGYAGQGDDRRTDMKGKTFLRGTQTTGADGRAVFASVYPGWYPGRTTHIHFKIINGGKTNLTSQLFLPDALSEFLYANLDDYKRNRLRDTLNSTDGIALEAGETVQGHVRESAGRYRATLYVKVDKNAVREVDPPHGVPPPNARTVGPARHATPEGADRIKALIPKAG